MLRSIVSAPRLSRYMFHRTYDGLWTGAKIFKSSILVFLVLMALAPVLRTLSAATSSDSIWALTAVLFILNALLTNYNPTHPSMHMQERYGPLNPLGALVSDEATKVYVCDLNQRCYIRFGRPLISVT